ncbi:hypothetical protein LC612_36210 [Nostoc sp. CHAB 5834]|nr:hypothetical protein [Nostoc sp. CHAB 5834]
MLRPVPDETTETIYIAPGAVQCRVYAIPYRMRPGQSPRDILPQYQKDWREIAMLDSRLNIRYISIDYMHLKDEIEGQMGGTFFTNDKKST